MLRNKPKICVYAICKDEIGHIERWIKSVNKADRIYIYDTGSTDGTLEKIQEIQKNDPFNGESYYSLDYFSDDYFKDKEYFNFGEARNIAFQFAKSSIAELTRLPEEVWIYVSLDLDEFPQEDFFDKLREWGKENLDYDNLPDIIPAKGLTAKENEEGYDDQTVINKIHFDKPNLYWDRPVHELLRNKGSRTVDIANVDPGLFKYIHEQDKGKPRDYLGILKHSYEEGDHSALTCIYYAWEADSNGEHDLQGSLSLEALENAMSNEEDPEYRDWQIISQSIVNVIKTTSSKFSSESDLDQLNTAINQLLTINQTALEAIETIPEMIKTRNLLFNVGNAYYILAEIFARDEMALGKETKNSTDMYLKAIDAYKAILPITKDDVPECWFEDWSLYNNDHVIINSIKDMYLNMKDYESATFYGIMAQYEANDEVDYITSVMKEFKDNSLTSTLDEIDLQFMLDKCKSTLNSMDKDEDIPTIPTMRPATSEERESVDNYVDSISQNTGVDFNSAISLEEAKATQPIAREQAGAFNRTIEGIDTTDPNSPVHIVDDMPFFDLKDAFGGAGAQQMMDGLTPAASPHHDEEKVVEFNSYPHHSEIIEEKANELLNQISENTEYPFNGFGLNGKSLKDWNSEPDKDLLAIIEGDFDSTEEVEEQKESVKNKICVYAICKNEAQFVEEWVKSMSEADAIVVLDTGSTDDTVEKFEQLGIHPVVKEIKPWRFDVARNEALKLCPPDCNILFSTDLDELLEPGWADIIRAEWVEGKHERGIYSYAWSHLKNGAPGRVFEYDKLHSRNWIWRCPVHELLWNTKTNTNSYNHNSVLNLFEKVHLHHFPDYSKSRGNYLPLLEQRAKEYPGDHYGLIYLAHEYSYRGFFNKSNEVFKFILKKFSDNYNTIEQASCYLFMGDNLRSMGKSEEALPMYDQAAELEPTYREPYIDKAKALMDLKRYKEAIATVQIGLRISERHFSWLERDLTWSYEPYDIMSLCYYYIDDRNLGKALGYAIKAAALDPNEERLRKNVDLIMNELCRY